MICFHLKYKSYKCTLISIPTIIRSQVLELENVYIYIFLYYSFITTMEEHCK